MASIPLEDLCSRFNATPKEKLASLREVGGTEQQFATANEHSKRTTDRRLESYTYSSLLDLTTIGDPERGVVHDRSIRLIVVGISGSGKSATANTLLHREEFHVSSSASVETMDTEMRSAEVGGRMLEVVDTAGSWNVPKDVFNTSDNEIYVLVINLSSPRFEERQLKKVRQIKNGQQPPDNELHVLVINLASPRFDNTQLKQLRKMKDSRGRSILRNKLCFLILTHASEALKSANLMEYIHEIKMDPLGELITKDLQGWQVMAINNHPDTEYEQRRRDEHITRLINAVNAQADRSMPSYLRLRSISQCDWKKITIVLLFALLLLLMYSYLYTSPDHTRDMLTAAPVGNTTRPSYRGHQF